mgnify:CR=1 FL=1
MASKIKELRNKAEKRGDLVGHLLPANWIDLKGTFTIEELTTIITAVKDNYIKANGNT